MHIRARDRLEMPPQKEEEQRDGHDQPRVSYAPRVGGNVGSECQHGKEEDHKDQYDADPLLPGEWLVLHPRDFIAGGLVEKSAESRVRDHTSFLIFPNHPLSNARPCRRLLCFREPAARSLVMSAG